MEETEFERKKRHASGQSTQSADSVTNYIPTPPDGGYGWMVVLAAFFIHVIVDGIAFSFGIFYGPFLEYYKVSEAKTALVGSLMTGFYLIMCVLASALVNKFGCRPVSIAGSLTASLGFLLSCFAPNIEILMVTYGVISGSGFALCYFPCIIAVSFYFQKRRAVATGIAVCGAGVGGFIFAPFGRYLLEVYDWQNAMLILSGVALNGCVFGALLRPLAPPKKKTRPRAKNALDRLKEKAKARVRARQESECSACAYNSGHHLDILAKINEVKQRREQMIRDEESESEFGSVPNSTLNSVRFLEHSDSCQYSCGHSQGQIATPKHTVSKPIDIEASRHHQANSHMSHSSSTSPGKFVPASAPPAFGSFPHGPSPPGFPETASIISSVLPEIVVDEEETGDPNDAGDEASNVVPLSRRVSRQSATISEAEERDLDEDAKENTPLKKKNSRTDSLGRRRSGHKPEHMLLERIRMEEGGSPSTNGSLPMDMNTAPVTVSQMIVNFDEQYNRAHSRSAGDVNAIHKIKKPKVYPGNRVPKSVQSDYARPLYRKDIFYSGSLLNVPELKSQLSLGVESYIKSVTSIPVPSKPEPKTPLCRCLPKSTTDVLKQMLDVSLFKDPAFAIACIANTFAAVGLFVPFIYLVDLAVQNGVETSNAAFLLSIVGILNMLGRVIAGALADLPQVNSMLLHNGALLVSGACCIFNMFSGTYAQLCVFAALFGLCIATFISLTSIVLCDLLGIEKLTNAFGLLCMIRGVASIAGPPIAGGVFESSQDYNVSFHFAGAMLITAGLLFCLLHLPMFHSKKEAEYEDPGFDDVTVSLDNLPVPENGQPNGILVKSKQDLPIVENGISSQLSVA